MHYKKRINFVHDELKCMVTHAEAIGSIEGIVEFIEAEKINKNSNKRPKPPKKYEVGESRAQYRIQAAAYLNFWFGDQVPISWSIPTYETFMDYCKSKKT